MQTPDKNDSSPEVQTSEMFAGNEPKTDDEEPN